MKEVLKLPNYAYLFDHEVFLKEYVAYVDEKVFAEFKAKDQVVKNKKDGEKYAKGEKKNVEGGIRQYIELLKPSNADAKHVYDLKTKLLNTLLNLVDSDQVNKTQQSVLYEDPRTDHIWYIMLEIASIPGFNYKEIKALDTIITTLNKVLQSLVEMSLDMQTVGKLAMVAEDVKKRQVFIVYLDQAQRVKRNEKIIDVQDALYSIIKKRQDNLNEYELFDPYLKSVASVASDAQNLVVAYNKLKEDLDKMKVRDFAFPEELQKYHAIFKIFSNYSGSSCFKNYYAEAVSQLNKKPGQISVEEYNVAINKAKERFLELKTKLPKFLQLKLAEIQELFKGVADPAVEVEALRKLEVIPDEELAKALKTFLIKFQERERARELCEFLLALFKTFNIPQGELSSHVQEYLKMLQEQANVVAENFSSLSNKMRIINSILNNDVLSTMIEEIAGAEELIKFVEATHEEDIKTMLDGLDEHGESLLRAQSIVELNIVKQCISKLDKSSEIKLLESMKDLIETQKRCSMA